MGRKQESEIIGTVNWAPRIHNLSKKDKNLFAYVASVRDMDYGDMVREYLLRGLAEDVRKLKINVLEIKNS